MNKTLAASLLAALAALATPGHVAAQLTKDAAGSDDVPFVFAGIRYGASIDDALKRFGQPARSEDFGASEKYFWAKGQLEVSFNKKTRLINGFTVTGSEGVSAVRRVDNEPLLRLLSPSQREVIRQLGEPTKIWYDNRRMSWDYEINRRVSASVFFECLHGDTKPCTQLSVHWSGTAIWDPNDGVDALGLRTSPICDYSFRIIKSLSIMLEQEPTGIKASNDKWDMEVYVSQTGNWALVGKSKDPNANSRHLCQLAKGQSTTPYVQQVWYQSYFGTNNAKP